MKVCPECAEEIKAAAVVCRFCGYRFAGSSAQAPSPPVSAPAPPTALSDAAAAMERAPFGVGRAIMLAAAVLVAIGSVGPWATSPLTSANGTSGDGVITLIVAVVLGMVALATSSGFVIELLAILIIGGVGIADFIHVHNALRAATFEGIQVDHVGWGLYVVIIGAVVALGGLLKTRLSHWEM